MNLLNSQWTAFVPARLGSKGLPNKNIRLMANKPLYLHAVDLALIAGASKVIVSTDITEILTKQFSSNVSVIERPSELCGDEVAMNEVLIHALKVQHINGPVVILQPTSPLRNATDIYASLNKLASGAFDMVMSVTEFDKSILKCGMIDSDGIFVPLSNPDNCFANRQSLPSVYKPNGAVYAMHADWFLKNQSFVTPRVGAVVMPIERSHDIDSLADFNRCEELITHIL